MTDAAAATDYRHPKCYANTAGGCSSKISGEHYISHGLIKLYSFDDPAATIRHDNGLGVRQFVQPKKFVAKVLCEKHNNGLSDADKAAIEFATFLRTIALRYRGGAGDWGDDESVEISGDDFQRWVLKLLLTHAAGNAFGSDGVAVKSPIINESVHLLLDRAAWPRDWGLYVAADTGHEHLKFDPFSRVETVTTDWCNAYPMFGNEGNAMRGGLVELAGVGFGLSLFNQGRRNRLHRAVGLRRRFDDPRNPARGTVQRPKCIAWVRDGVEKRINFAWEDPYEHKSITYTMQP